jgi:poly-gamma-glutamate system protein
MEAALQEAGVFEYRSKAASIGGDEDVGRGLSPEGLELILSAIERNGIPRIDEPTLKRSVERRLELFDRDDIRGYVNVGRGAASLGNPEIAGLFAQGVKRRLRRREVPSTSVMLELAMRGVPVASVSDVEAVAERYSMPQAPREIAEPGQGRLFVEYRYSIVLAILFAALLVVLLYIFVRTDVQAHLKKTKE